MIAQSALPAGVAEYGPIVVLIVAVAALCAAMLLLAHLPGKYRLSGRVKDTPYESGMPPIGDARGRFNVRFYLVAMLFLLFDVELIFMYPWAKVFFESAGPAGATPAWASPALGGAQLPAFLVGEMVIFVAVLMVGYVYAWRTGVFRWE